jgi:hypothetical protein
MAAKTADRIGKMATSTITIITTTTGATIITGTVTTTGAMAA